MLETALIGGAASLAGGLLGASERSRAAQQAQDQIRASILELENIGIPSQQAQQIVLQQYKEAGQLTPELEQSILQGESGLLGIQTDPLQQEAMNNALLELQGIGQGGERLSDVAAREQGMGAIESRSRGAREAIEQEMRAKNQFGGGAELAMKLANQQDAATQANQLGLGINQQAQDRALQAIIESGKLGASQQQQQFGQKSAQQQAQDAINQFNAANRQGVVQRNVAAMNAAQAANLQNKQNIMNQNVGLANQQEVANKGLAQQEFQNKLAVGQTKANARTGLASNIQQTGNQNAAMWTGLGQGVGEAFQGYGQGIRQNERDAKADANTKRYLDIEEMKAKKGII